MNENPSNFKPKSSLSDESPAIETQEKGQDVENESLDLNIISDQEIDESEKKEENESQKTENIKSEVEIDIKREDTKNDYEKTILEDHRSHDDDHLKPQITRTHNMMDLKETILALKLP